MDFFFALGVCSPAAFVLAVVAWLHYTSVDDATWIAKQAARNQRRRDRPIRNRRWAVLPYPTQYQRVGGHYDNSAVYPDGSSGDSYTGDTYYHVMLESLTERRRRRIDRGTEAASHGEADRG